MNQHQESISSRALKNILRSFTAVVIVVLIIGAGVVMKTIKKQERAHRLGHIVTVVGQAQSPGLVPGFSFT